MSVTNQCVRHHFLEETSISYNGRQLIDRNVTPHSTDMETLNSGHIQISNTHNEGFM